MDKNARDDSTTEADGRSASTETSTKMTTFFPYFRSSTHSTRGTCHLESWSVGGGGTDAAGVGCPSGQPRSQPSTSWKGGDGESTSLRSAEERGTRNARQ